MEIHWHKVENLETGNIADYVGWKNRFNGKEYGDFIDSKNLVGDPKEWAKKAWNRVENMILNK